MNGIKNDCFKYLGYFFGIFTDYNLLAFVARVCLIKMNMRLPCGLFWQAIASSNLMCLYGLHERYLNNLVSRFDEGLISDLYSYVHIKFIQVLTQYFKNTVLLCM